MEMPCMAIYMQFFLFLLNNYSIVLHSMSTDAHSYGRLQSSSPLQC